MPRQTFFNLPEDKRKKIIDIALDEFAGRPYSKASLSRIVARAGIAKGSMYQYFEDKKDLFMYLLELAAGEKLAYIEQEVDPGADFFTAFEQSMLAGIRFNLDHPKLSRVIANAMDSTGEEALHDFIVKGRKMTLEYFSQMVRRGQEQGSIRKDIDIKLASYMVSSMLSQGLTEYILDILGGSAVDDLLKKPELAERLNEEQIKGIIDETMKLLRNGLQP
ncbi:transcriptional regulator, TetR family [Thermincola ferriacetica]|uniref:Transcriptional regulator, TetR family n=1 Tax=Thermincola ferriacetica TaxID=281456 RepID=A0A0L6W0I9_9FIRM|nr:TetR/AcrR family transcriptional regulator [Thermincola ferriacetica]KNZ69045.1 transcriptional regulator, TetR family [Thermincola ferriacetica]